ncbi:conserved Plasmodium protein, unknown function [Babesia microti strain RI]|uniref:Uncharacterized protein n=1 Tax=Babesia microti (strain RI) TaxID=1133968 RepID=A0A1R4AA08_BABMR|nr:conserved Plasmodium protein, unknown function [Babesia microti strain RI]SJK85851.1 conserved Plasmodium protein, unknown function [Babesia microti strain RI]|eukprot:XP_012647959.2 conserved Plasmodium protein, unknown function [Babesia microti strain RI]
MRNMSNMPSNQNNNSQCNSQQNGQQYNSIQHQQQYIDSQQLYMQYQHHINTYGISPHIPPGYPVPLDPVQYHYHMPQIALKINPNIAHPVAQVQNSPSWNQQPPYNLSSSPIQQQHLYLSPQSKNYVQYENGAYKIQYRNQHDPSASIQPYHSPNMQKQEINGDREQINPRIVGYDYRNNVCKYRQGMGERNVEMQRYQYEQQKRSSQGSNVPIETFVSIERELANERSKLRECIFEDCRLVFGEIQKLQSPFTLYDVNGTKFYSIRDVLAHLLPYHLYSFDFYNLSQPYPHDTEIKDENMGSETKFDNICSRQIDDIRNKLDSLSNDDDLTTVWRCYKAIMKSISNHNTKLNETIQNGIDGENDRTETNANMQQSMSYAQCMGYMQYTGTSWSGQPHNPEQQY